MKSIVLVKERGISSNVRRPWDGYLASSYNDVSKGYPLQNPREAETGQVHADSDASRDAAVEASCNVKTNRYVNTTR